ncbi:MAG: sodium/calcium exchanger rane protein [Frankiales bacterium]|nr:sodium/calcium exchanger rane protein [Frankiales bacterium]
MLLGCAAVIYLACEWFVNAVEWLGVEFKVGAVAVGTILAAVGTALPESVVTLVAVLFGSRQQGDDIAVGAAMGGPLVVGTIAYGVAGAVLIWRRQRATAGAAISGSSAAEDRDTLPAPDLTGVDTGRLAKDQAWFLAIYVGKVALGLLAFAIKPWLGLLFFAAYGVYFWRELRADGAHASEEELAPLKLQPRVARPARWAVLSQTAATLVLIFLASQLFVRQLEWAGPELGLSPVVVALLLAPVATELPEVLNAVIWVRQGKTQLALANISGSMMIQATVPSGIGILFTAWHFDAALILAAAMTASAISYLMWLLKAGKLTGGRLAGAFGFYAAFAVGLVFVA